MAAFRSFFGSLAPAPAADLDTEELSSLLKAVLPTFIANVDRTRQGLPEPGLVESQSLSSPSSTDSMWNFYLELFTALTNLQAVLVSWDPSEIIRSSSEAEAPMKAKLKAAVHGLDGCFLSRKGDSVASAFRRLKIEPTEIMPFWKLRALKVSARMPSRDEELPEDYLEDISIVIRMENKSANKRDRLLHDIQAAVTFFHEMDLFKGHSGQPCPLHYTSYPMRHVTRLSKKLFTTVQSSWTCQCDGGRLHTSRNARLSLTQHRRFETAPVRGSQVSEEEHCFRIFFPTTAREVEWQDTDITIDIRGHLQDTEPDLVEDGLCGVILNVKPKLRPRLVVWTGNLWRVTDDVEEHASVLTQVKDADFLSLRDLLVRQHTRNHNFSHGPLGDLSWKPKDRLKLSFILATSLLHFFTDPRLGADLTSESVCFVQSRSSQSLDITRPYLNVICKEIPCTDKRPSKTRNQPHRYPDILALGILLLEIERGVPIYVDESQDPCVVAINELNAWIKSGLSSERRRVPEGLFHAINACIRPREYTLHKLDRSNPTPFQIRTFIFQRILYPLEQALSTAYEIRSHSLLADITLQRALGRGMGFSDGEENSQLSTDQQVAARKWMDEWRSSVSALVYACQDQCEKCLRRDKTWPKATRVRVAVLDTGLQLPCSLQSVYEDDKRILMEQSWSFITEPDADGTSNDWRTDSDGHGSLVGEIMLRCAPCLDLHVAKVFKTREDLSNPALAAQVHQRIADAIDKASRDWKVDIVVMSFGFEQPIRLIRDAIDRALAAETKPLFFAATGNNGAHRDIAWPAYDNNVIGISSTTAEGAASTFNSQETEDAKPIFYAFGQDVPVKVARADDARPYVDTYVSGTSYATPIAAALVASLVGCVRMLLKVSSPDAQARFAHVPKDLHSMRGTVRVVHRKMLRTHQTGQQSILPWEFLHEGMSEGTELLEQVDKAINGKVSLEP